MAVDPQPKPVKRRPSKPRSPLKTVKKAEAKPKVAKKVPAKTKPKSKTSFKAKMTTKKPIITKKPPVRKKPAAKKKPTQSQLISIPLGRGAKLVLTVNRTTTKSKAQKPKPKKSTKPKQTDQAARLSKKQQLLISLAFLLTGLLGTAFFGMQAVASPTPQITTPTLVLRSKAPVVKYMPSSVPTSLRIPDIQINTTIIPVGLDKEGALIVPDNSNVAGWYDKSPTPGQKGHQ